MPGMPFPFEKSKRKFFSNPLFNLLNIMFFLPSVMKFNHYSLMIGEDERKEQWFNDISSIFMHGASHETSVISQPRS
jgi:hypothetical protein